MSSNAFGFTARLDPDSIATLFAFENYQTELEPALEKAMVASLSLLQARATDWMYANFQNPTGAVEEDFWEVNIPDPYHGILSNTAPYAVRLEYGFSGQTDSLGRYFPLWPGGPRDQFWHGYHWANETIRLSRFKIQDLFQSAIDYANLQLGRTTP